MVCSAVGQLLYSTCGTAGAQDSACRHHASMRQPYLHPQVLDSCLHVLLQHLPESIHDTINVGHQLWKSGSYAGGVADGPSSLLYNMQQCTTQDMDGTQNCAGHTQGHGNINCACSNGCFCLASRKQEPNSNRPGGPRTRQDSGLHMGIQLSRAQNKAQLTDRLMNASAPGSPTFAA